VRGANGIPANGSWPSRVNRRAIFMMDVHIQANGRESVHGYDVV
jgi:hypothetical protein